MAVRKSWQQAFEEGAAGIGEPTFIFIDVEPEVQEAGEWVEEPVGSVHLGEVQHTPERHTEASERPVLALPPVSQGQAQDVT